jgi:hydroxyacylglutathione hydrolase
MCASGQRAAIAASLLERSGYKNVDVYLGSMSAWQQQKHAA